MEVLSATKTAVIGSEISRTTNLSYKKTKECLDSFISAGLVKVLEGSERTKAQKESITEINGKIFLSTDEGKRAVEQFEELSTFFKNGTFSLLFHIHNFDFLVEKLKLLTEPRILSDLYRFGTDRIQIKQLLETLEGCGVVESVKNPDHERPYLKDTSIFYINTSKGAVALKKAIELQSLLTPSTKLDLTDSIKKVGLRSSN